MPPKGKNTGKISKPGPDSPGGPRVQRACEVCQGEFWPRKRDVDAGKGKHCSTNCSSKAFRKAKAYTCEGCGALCSSTNIRKLCDPCLKKAHEAQRTHWCKKCGCPCNRYHCAECWKSVQESVRRTPEELREYNRERGKRRRLADPEREKRRIAAWSAANREKCREHTRQGGAKYRERHADEMREKRRTPEGALKARLQRQKRRARLLNLNSKGVSKAEWFSICDKFKDASGVVRCVYCSSGEATTIDHVVPIFKGGLDDANNVVPACVSCNSSKGHRSIAEWHKSADLPPALLAVLLEYEANYAKGVAA